jgi:hypothetical protein
VTDGPVGPLFKAAAATLGASLLLEVGGILLVDRGGKALSVMAGVATVAGGALLRWSIVRAGRSSARDREGTVEAMKPREGSPGWWRA